MKKILYTTDYSLNSVAALKFAYSLGKITNTDVIALHVTNTPQSETSFHKNSIRTKHQKKLENFCSEHLGDSYNNLELSAAVIKGDNVPQAILNFSRDMNIFMLVMGACGTGTLAELILGSTTKAMLDISTFPVLAVPSDYEFKGLNKVMYSCLFQDEDVHNIADLVDIVAPLNVEIEIVHVTHKDELTVKANLEKFKAKVNEIIDYKNISYKLVFSDNVFESLRASLEEIQPDMLVMLERKTKPELSNILYRDKVKRMQSCTKVPLLSYPASFK